MSSLIIEVLSSTVTTVPSAKGSYQMCELAFKNLSFQGKVEGKKLVSFAEKEVFAKLSTANGGDVFTVTRVKDENGYWKWVAVLDGKVAENTSPVQADYAATTTATSGAKQTPKSTYETPEERAAKQLMIAKQSSLERAIQLFELNGNKKASSSDVIAIAQQFVDYVMGNTVAANVEDVGFNDDIPF